MRNREKAMERGCIRALLPVQFKDKVDQSNIRGRNYVFYFYVFIWDMVDG